MESQKYYIFNSDHHQFVRIIIFKLSVIFRFSDYAEIRALHFKVEFYLHLLDVSLDLPYFSDVTNANAKEGT